MVEEEATSRRKLGEFLLGVGWTVGGGGGDPVPFLRCEGRKIAGTELPEDVEVEGGEFEELPKEDTSEGAEVKSPGREEKKDWVLERRRDLGQQV